jgi:hypothetical protein
MGLPLSFRYRNQEPPKCNFTCLLLYATLFGNVLMTASIVITVAEMYLPSQTMDLPVTAITQNPYSEYNCVAYCLCCYIVLKLS